VRLSRFLAPLAAAAFVVGPASAGIAAGGPSPAQPAVSSFASLRIDNFGQINPTYFRGGQPEGRDYVDLAALGVKTVINLTSDDAEASEPLMAKQAGLSYVQIPMTTHTVPTAAQLEQFLSLVNDPTRQPVFVHCVGGRHRTGVMTAAYRMSHDGWTADRAFQEMKQFKFGADFLHREFKNFIYGYVAAPRAPVQAVKTEARAGE
jgi:tyrosine-protein phosphatase SIW14